MNIYKQRPDDPFVVFCVCISYVHLISQKFTLGKNGLVIQVTDVQLPSFINKSTFLFPSLYSFVPFWTSTFTCAASAKSPYSAQLGPFTKLVLSTTQFTSIAGHLTCQWSLKKQPRSLSPLAICSFNFAHTPFSLQEFDLTREIGYNLACIYHASGNTQLALSFRKKYCVI